MKILMITLHHTYNCGSSLQAFALQDFLINNGHEVEIIDYRPKYLVESKAKLLCKKVIYFREYKKGMKHVKEFRSKYLKVTKDKYKSYKLLEKKPPKADVYITGSDQLWNGNYPCGKDLAYYLKFIKEGSKMAYAVSLGRDSIDQSEIQWIYYNVKDFRYISVREVSSKVALEKEGWNNVEYVCDPVLLLNKKVYLTMQIVPSSTRYVVVYLVSESDLLEELIAIIKMKYNLEVIVIGAFLHKCTCDKQVRGLSPCEFLGYIANADFVVASSFHATVFSHIFEREFAIILPQENGARIEQFLEVTGLENRIVKTSSDIDRVMETIDYREPRKKLEGFIKKSQAILIDQLSELEK